MCKCHRMAGPLPNVDYMLTLGPSIAPEPGDAPVETVFAGLRYDFRPASADTEQPGVLLLGKDNRVCLDVIRRQRGTAAAQLHEPNPPGGAPVCLSVYCQGN